MSLFAEDDGDIADAVAAEIDAAAPEDLSPKNNPALRGHESVEKALLADFNASRMPHAIIFAGLPGIGKAMLAYRLARFLLSQTESQGASLFGDDAPPETLYVAPENPVFRRVASGGHADLLVVERSFDEKKGRLQTEIPVEAARRVAPFLRRTAAEGGWRVVIVDGAECLNSNSQNALLKILEEPPKKTVLMLTTSQPGAFLPTIRSRCRMVPVAPLSEGDIGALLDQHAPGLPLDQKAALVRVSEGSIGKALQFHQDDGVALYKDMLKLISNLPELDVIAAQDFAEKAGKYGAERTYETARDILTGWCGRLARLQARGESVVDVLPGDADIFRKLMAAYPPRHFLQTWEKTAQLFRQAENYNLDKKQALLSAFLMLQKPDYTGPVI